jgi:phosphoribosylglycinamide formyltransferase-1
VLTREHVIYPRAVRWFVQGLLRIEGDIVTHTLGEPQLLV